MAVVKATNITIIIIKDFLSIYIIKESKGTHSENFYSLLLSGQANVSTFIERSAQSIRIRVFLFHLIKVD